MNDRHTEPESASLPIGEAARQLGVSVDTMRRWGREGRIRSFRTLGNQRRYRQSDIDALLSTPSLGRLVAAGVEVGLLEGAERVEEAARRMASRAERE